MKHFSGLVDRIPDSWWIAGIGWVVGGHGDLTGEDEERVTEYQLWCKENTLSPTEVRTIEEYLCEKYGIDYRGISLGVGEGP